jgi:hypothetical protein
MYGIRLFVKHVVGGFPPAVKSALPIPTWQSQGTIEWALGIVTPAMPSNVAIPAPEWSPSVDQSAGFGMIPKRLPLSGYGLGPVFAALNTKSSSFGRRLDNELVGDALTWPLVAVVAVWLIVHGLQVMIAAWMLVAPAAVKSYEDVSVVFAVVMNTPTLIAVPSWATGVVCPNPLRVLDPVAETTAIIASPGCVAAIGVAVAVATPSAIPVTPRTTSLPPPPLATFVVTLSGGELGALIFPAASNAWTVYA